MKQVVLFLLLVGSIFSNVSFAQTLKGKVTDTSGKPIPSASIYIKEIKQGLICNADGEFQIKLKAGMYQLECTSIGYHGENKTVSIDDKDKEIQFVLTEKNYQLPDVEIQSGEDPAYEIMRKTIAKAPYYQSVIKKMTYEAYCKGSGKMTSMPVLIERIGKDEIGLIKDKLFLMESVTKVNFEEPDRYEKFVTAFSSSFPYMDDPKEAMIPEIISLYAPKIYSRISPLNPKAFNYYRFRYEGYVEENGQIINIIAVIPKLKDPQLIKGVIHIADDEWNIRHADLYFSGMGANEHSIYNYNRVIEDIYLVTNEESHVDFNIIGIKFYADFLSSCQYTDIQLNDSLINARSDSEKAKSKKKERKSLEIKRNEDITADSLAGKRDSLYWINARTVMLNEEELQSYARRDTLRERADSISNARRNPKFRPFDLVGGGVAGKDSSFVQVRYFGLLEALTKYNFVDGFWLGQSFELNFKRKKNTGFVFKPSAYWASARKTLIYKGDIIFDYAPLKRGQLRFSAGSLSIDYSADSGPERIVNTLFSLYGGRNLSKFYDKKYAEIFHSIDIDNGLRFDAELTVAKRTTLENHTSWNVFGIKDKWTPNRPEYAQDLNDSYSGLAAYRLGLQYTPEYYYEIRNGKKYYRRSAYPTFMIGYQQGFSAGNMLENYSRFSKAQVAIYQTVNLDIFSRINYALIAGKFFNKNPFNYIDYKHFGTAGNTWFSAKFVANTYNLLPFYEYSTDKEWIQAFVNYRTDYLLLKRLPFLQGKLFNENLHFKFLHIPGKPYYSEWGYSIDLPAGMASIGVYAAFDKTQYNGVGFQFSLPLMKLTER
jgi:hypothetical protein